MSEVSITALDDDTPAVVPTGTSSSVEVGTAGIYVGGTPATHESILLDGATTLPIHTVLTVRATAPALVDVDDAPDGTVVTVHVAEGWEHITWASGITVTGATDTTETWVVLVRAEGAWRALVSSSVTGNGGGGLSGEGRPSSALDASVGTIYTDTLMTTGALLWVRTPAGWVTHHADTGVRDIRPLVDDVEWRRNGGPATIRRAGSLVTLALDLYSRGSWAIPDTSSPLTLPAGFTPENDVMAWVGIGGEDGQAWANISRITGKMDIWTKAGFVLSDWTEFGLTLTYSTADEWPTALPGQAT